MRQPNGAMHRLGSILSALVLVGLMGQSLTAQEGRPNFSWDHVPIYAHVGIGRGLGAEQYQFLAEHYDFIVFTGGEFDREYRGNDALTFESIVQSAAAEVKRHNPRAKVLFYWAADLAKPHNKRSNALIPENGRFEVQRNARTTVDVFDTTNAELRTWWSDVAGRAVHEYGCDGIFVDGATAFTPGSFYEQKLGTQRCEELEQGMFQMLSDAKRKMGAESIMLLNPLHAPHEGQELEEALGWRYLPYVDGAMVDDFDRAANLLDRRQSKEYIAGTIRIMSEAAQRGEIVVFKAWPGFTWWSAPELMAEPHARQYEEAVNNLDFPLACFLIGAGEHCYFCYSWG
ncbi:MAG: hypothetical protein KDA83_09980 [Planctomycetales bacterium]|nr:hypothetical protein [Planctomycetales bacterium]